MRVSKQMDDLLIYWMFVFLKTLLMRSAGKNEKVKMMMHLVGDILHQNVILLHVLITSKTIDILRHLGVSGRVQLNTSIFKEYTLKIKQIYQTKELGSSEPITLISYLFSFLPIIFIRCTAKVSLG